MRKVTLRKPRRKTAEHKRHQYVVPEKDKDKLTADSAEAKDYRVRITANWNKQVPTILEIGRELCEIRDKLKRGQVGPFLKTLPFHPSVAQALMRIWRNPVLRKPEHAPFLPPSWATLAAIDELDLPEDALEQLITTGRINTNTERPRQAARLPRRKWSRSAQ